MPWMTPLELQTADCGAPRGVPTAAQGHSLPTHWNHRPVWRMDLGSLPRRSCLYHLPTFGQQRPDEVLHLSFFGDLMQPKAQLILAWATRLLTLPDCYTLLLCRRMDLSFSPTTPNRMFVISFACIKA